MPATRYPLLSTLLRRYFYSGWAFLIPYLAAYLLYYLIGWPVNPPTDVSSTAHSPSPFAPPPLIHLYWALHVIHLILAGAALQSWLQDRRAAARLSVASPYSLPTALAPWALLALIFYIPGVYLEWPSDPWDHLRRINEWSNLHTVDAHSSWRKSAYFIPYSLLNWCTGAKQLFWLDFYYTGTCLLLCWQYYRLSRACGLGDRASMIFVIIQALLFGNNIFSFYRYYGISSSIYAQLGAIALIRIVLEFAAKGTNLEPRLQRDTKGSTNPDTPSAHGLSSALPCYSLLATRYSLPSLICEPLKTRPSFWRVFVVFHLSSIAFCLLSLIAFNHIQGLGIAGLSIAAIIAWRLVRWAPATGFWLAGGAMALSVTTVLWFPRHPALDDVYRPQGWLTTWYGFNFFSPTSPAVERSLHILGYFGALNLILGVWLIVRRNHIAGWLTLMPVVALALPCFALPFAHVVAASTSPGNIITFHRMLLAIPMGLALVAALCPKNLEKSAVRPEAVKWLRAVYKRSSSVISLSILLALTLAPSTPSYNRFWHSVLSTQDDLQLTHLLRGGGGGPPAQTESAGTLTMGTPLRREIQHVFSLADNVSWERLRLADAHSFSGSVGNRQRDLDAIIRFFEPTVLNTDSVYSDEFAFRRRAVTTPEIAAAPTSANHPWIVLGGVPPHHTFANGRLTVSNPPGNDSVAFHHDLIPISRYRRYLLTSRVRQTGSTAATNFLAVAWYDGDEQLLPSRTIQPEGAGAPWGWNNSTYSYYGLVDQPAPAAWTQYSMSFGLGEKASIPANASYLRIGALLNYRAAPAAKVEITDVILIENPTQSHMLLTLPRTWHLLTPASQAALLSGHWSAQDVPTAHAGTQELRSTAINFRPLD